MTIPITGIVFLFGAIVYIFSSHKFYQCWKRENNYIAKLFAYAFFLLGLHWFLNVIPCLMFIGDQALIWRIIDPARIFFLFTGITILGYTMSYIRFPKYKWLAVILLSTITITAIWLFIISPPTYFYINGSLGWEIEPIIGIISFLPIALTVVPMGIVFFQEARRAEDKRVKIRAFGLGLAMCWGIFPSIMDFILGNFFKIPPLYSDLSYLGCFLFLFITILLTWKPALPRVRVKI